MNKYILLFILASLFINNDMLFAQEQRDIFATLASTSEQGGVVKITQDNKIKELVNLHITMQRSVNGVKGYRISIFRDSGQEAKNNANQVVSKFVANHEDVKSYIRFEYPFYKVYVGDFRTRSEAEKFLNVIEREYPSAFIREDMISFPD